MERRKLDFDRFEAVAAGIQHLHAGGYTQIGSWDLSRVCDHLTRFMRMSMEGFPFQFPWVMRRLVGPLLLKPLVMRTRRLPAGVKAPAPRCYDLCLSLALLIMGATPAPSAGIPPEPE